MGDKETKHTVLKVDKLHRVCIPKEMWEELAKEGEPLAFKAAMIQGTMVLIPIQ